MILKDVSWTLQFKALRLFGLVLTTENELKRCKVNVYCNEHTGFEIYRKDRPMLVRWCKRLAGM